MLIDVSIYKPISIKSKTSESYKGNYETQVISDRHDLDVFKHLFFLKKNSYYDFERAAKKIGYDYSLLKLDGVKTDEENNIVFQFKSPNKKRVEIKNPPSIEKTELCLAVDEIYHQNITVNDKFYEDFILVNDGCITDKNTLTEHSEEYFSNDRNFKSIVSNFVEGQNYVLYNYGLRK